MSKYACSRSGWSSRWKWISCVPFSLILIAILSHNWRRFRPIGFQCSAKCNGIDVMCALAAAWTTGTGRRSTRDKTIYDATFCICLGIRFCASGIGHESSHHNKTEATEKRKSENIACVTLINGKSNWKIRFANVCGGKIFIAIRSLLLLLLLCARWIEYSKGNRQATIRLVHRELQKLHGTEWGKMTFCMVDRHLKKQKMEKPNRKERKNGIKIKKYQLWLVVGWQRASTFPFDSGRIEFKAIWRLLLLQFCDQLKMAVFMSMLIVVFVFLFFIVGFHWLSMALQNALEWRIAS